MTSCTTTNAVNIACHSRNGSKCHSKQAKQAKNRIPLIRCSRTVRPADVHKQRKRHMRFLLISTHVRPKSKRQLVRNPVIVKLTTVEHIRVGICKNWGGKNKRVSLVGIVVLDLRRHSCDTSFGLRNLTAKHRNMYQQYSYDS